MWHGFRIPNPDDDRVVLVVCREYCRDDCDKTCRMRTLSIDGRALRGGATSWHTGSSPQSWMMVRPGEG